MENNFWNQLELPVVGLAPMDGVTDQPYRHIQKKYGSPDVVYTEFTNVEGICHEAFRLLKDFLFDETQRPIVAQIYGTTPKYFRQVATVLCELGFDGIDINMGCPAKSVQNTGSGAALIQTPKLAQEIIRETKAGVQDYRNGMRAKDCPDISEQIAREVERRHENLPELYKQDRSIPVSVKTRVGYHTPVVDEWIPTLMELEPAVIAVHGRTLKQQYSGKSAWEEIQKGAKYTKGTNTLYFGNGDVLTRQQAEEYSKKYDVDGVLIARGSFGNPFCFTQNAEENYAAHNMFKIALEHCYLFEETYKDDERYNFLPMRKHLGWYVKGIPGAKELRVKVFQTNSPEEVAAIFKEYGLV